MLSLWIVSALATLAHATTTSPPSYNCTQITLLVHVNVQTTELNIQPFTNQTQLTTLVTEITSVTSNVSAEVTGGMINLDASYKIWSQLCVPAGFSSSGTLEFAIHGINFGHSYWTFGGLKSPYNYVEAAMKAGNAVFIYDRLGVGNSSKPDGIKEVQASTEVAVAADLIKRLRDGLKGFKFGKIIGVGHSFGSANLVGLVAKHGNILDGIVLTGFSTYSASMSATFAGFGLKFASKQDHKRFGSLTTSYLATGGTYNDQLTFFYSPGSDFGTIELAERTKETLTVGELLTQNDLSKNPATSYTGPIFVVTGDKDYIFCGGNCYQALNGSANLLQSASKVFPSASSFSTYIPPATGHAVNQHFSAPETFKVIQNWIAKH